MFRNRIIKILALLMVLNLLIIPLTSFTPQQQNKYKVYAAAGIVDIRFFNAVISMIGITAAGLATMSPSFSIPEVDLIEMKNNFAQTLETDTVKKQAWIAAQTEYLSGGVAQTMGAVELAKIGLNDIYIQFKEYLKTKYLDVDLPAGVTEENYIANFGKYEITTSGDTKLIRSRVWNEDSTYGDYFSYLTQYEQANDFRNKKAYINVKNTESGLITNLMTVTSTSEANIFVAGSSYWFTATNVTPLRKDLIYMYKSVMILLGIKNVPSTALALYGDTIPYPTGIIKYKNSNIINTTDENINVINTIPWVNTTVPIGTIVTPAISAPYAGAVPIDVPISVPIDPTDPIDPPIEDDPTLIGTVAAILAGILPISGILDNIKVGQETLIDVIVSGITGVIDGIGDIAGTLTGGITSSLTDIQSSISTLTAPATETINLDPVKNIPQVLFTKFPFSIPWDLYNVYNLMATDNRSPPEFELGIPLTNSNTLSALGTEDLKMELKLENYDDVLGVIRVGELLLFVIGLIFGTKRLIWG